MGQRERISRGTSAVVAWKEVRQLPAGVDYRATGNGEIQWAGRMSTSGRKRTSAGKGLGMFIGGRGSVRLAIDPGSVRVGEEGDRVDDVLGLAEAAQGERV